VGQHGGITRVDLRAGGEGRMRMTVAGRGAGLELPPFPLGGPLLMRLTADDGRCWQTEYLAPTRDDASSYRAALSE